MRLFNQVKLRTPESVELDFTLAGIGNRALALIIDYLALLLLWMGFVTIWLILSEQILEIVVTLTGDANGVDLWLGAITTLVTFALYEGYFVFFESVWQGQTPGKRYSKIRVIRDDGRNAGLAQATLRALLRPVDDLFLFGAFLIFFSPREKRLGDFVAGTIVIQEEQSAVAANFPVSDAAQNLAHQLLQIAHVSQLLPDDFAVIREYLQRRGQMTREAKSEVNLQLARQVKQVIGLDKVPPNTTPDVFLEAVYLAYQQQSQS